MAYIKTFKGARLDLQFYKGKATIDFEINVFNDDETELDLSVYDEIIYKMFHKIHGTRVLTLVMSDGGLQFNSPMDNEIMLNLSDVQSLLRPKEYWQECYGLREDSEEELIFFGVAHVI